MIPLKGLGTLAAALPVAATALSLSLMTAPAQAQPAEGEIVVVQPTEPPNIDPGNHAYSYTGPIIYQNVIETLNQLDLKTGEMSPRLATSWEQSGDTTYRYTLREGVTFHDGTPFNADAVVYSVDRLFNTGVEAMARNKYWDHMSVSAEKIDDYTVELIGTQPEPLFFSRMSQVPIVAPSTPMNELTREPIGTGPYRMTAWDPGVQIVLEVYEDYWGEQPEVKKATYVFRGEGSVRANMVEVGEADFTFTIPEEMATTDLDKPYLNYETVYFIVGAWTPPLDDVRVRRAVDHAIDRDAIIGTIMPAATIPATALVVPGTAGHDASLEQTTYDPALSRQLLEEARADGVDVDTEIKVMYINNQFPGSNEILEAATLMLADAGFNVQMELVETGIYREQRDEPRTEGPPVILLSRHDNDKGDAGFSYPRHLCASNREPVCSEALDAAILAALETPEGPERDAKWHEVQRMMKEEIVGDVYLGHQVAFARVGPRINYDFEGKGTSYFLLEEVTFN
jgi:peptide/nickel transport system substrate-binding protein